MKYAYEDGTECSETFIYKIQTSENYPKESIRHLEHGENLKSGKLIVPELAKKFPAFCKNRRFITAFIRTHHLSLSRARSIQSIPPPHFLKIYFTVNIPSTHRSSKWSLSPHISSSNSCTRPSSVQRVPRAQRI
jgi:hypothetical protein